MEVLLNWIHLKNQVGKILPLGITITVKTRKKQNWNFLCLVIDISSIYCNCKFLVWKTKFQFQLEISNYQWNLQSRHEIVSNSTIDWNQLILLVHILFFSGFLAHSIASLSFNPQVMGSNLKKSKNFKKDVMFWFIYQAIRNQKTIYCWNRYFQLNLIFQVKLEILSRAWIFNLGLKFQFEHEIYNTIFRKLRFLQRML
jgi:hypothetical protein